MSVASEFAPEVFIPERARRTTADRRRAHLSLVVDAPASVDCPAGAARGIRVLGLSEPAFDDVPSTAAASRPVRLTRRGVLALSCATALAALGMLVLAYLSAGSSGTPAAAPRLGAGATVTVQPGDTLWSIAERAEPQRDPRQVVDRLRTVNHLSSVALTPGQTLKLQ